MKDKHLVVYSSDASGVKGIAKKVVFPKNVNELRKIISSGEKFTIRGAGSGLVGGAVPQHDIVIDISKLNKILEFDPVSKTVEVEAGVILDELNELLEKYNLEFPIKPGSHSICTIGGMIATNAAGERAIKYGKTDKWVESLEIVDGKGEIIKIGKYNLADFIGMEGVTGVIVKARLRLTERQQRSALLIAFDNLDAVIENVENFKQLEDVSEIEFLDRLTSNLIGLEKKYHLIIELESEESPYENIKVLRGLEYDAIMERRDKVYPSLAAQGYVRIEDPKIALNRFKELALMLEYMRVPYYGHIGLGIIHPVFKLEEKEKIAKLFEFVKKIKGEISGEHGLGLIKKEFLDENTAKLISRVRKRYDPSCKLNCGKVV